MNVVTELATLVTNHSRRLGRQVDLDRYEVPTMPPAPPPESTEPTEPMTPWQAARLQLFRNLDPNSEQLSLEMLLNSGDLRSTELTELYHLPGLSEEDRDLIQRHAKAPTSLLVEHFEHLGADKSDAPSTSIDDQVRLLKRLTDVPSDQHLELWSKMFLRAADSPKPFVSCARVEAACPSPQAALHAVIKTLIDTGETIPSVFQRYVAAGRCTPATVCLFDLESLLEMVSSERMRGLPSDFLGALICDLVTSACEADASRWARLFDLAASWSGSVGKMLDAVDRSLAVVPYRSPQPTMTLRPQRRPGRSGVNLPRTSSLGSGVNRR